MSTPLHLAAKRYTFLSSFGYGLILMIKVLMVRFRGHAHIVHTLMELGANTELVDSNGWTAHEIAKACGHESISNFIRLRQRKILTSDPKSVASSVAQVVWMLYYRKTSIETYIRANPI
jgi:hypothetical protein